MSPRGRTGAGAADAGLLLRVVGLVLLTVVFFIQDQELHVAKLLLPSVAVFLTIIVFYYAYFVRFYLR